jgi:hypothetical protein
VKFVPSGQAEPDQRPFTKTLRLHGFRNFVPKQAFARYRWEETHFLVKRDHGPPAEGAASFHITRETIVGRAAQSHAREAKCALVEIDESTRTPFEALVISEGRLGP